MDEKRDKGLARDFRIDRAKIDKEKRTVELAFSSETPVERWGGNEILSHDKGDYDFSRLNDSHPLLLGHNEQDPDSQIGVIEPGTARVDGDKIGRAVVRFSRSPKAEQIFQDVQDGIRSLVSVGYDRTDMISSEKMPDGMMNCRYRWMPTHIAIVPVPADTKAGVGRERVDSPQNPNAEEREQKPNFMPEKELTVQIEEARADERTKTKATTLEAERKRAKDITTIADALIRDHGKKNGGQMESQIRAMVSEALAKDETVEAFQNRCMTDVLKAKPAEPTLIEHCADEDGQRNYSILRGIQSCIKRQKSGHSDFHIPDGLEGEVHQEALRRAKAAGGAEETIDAGFMVPANAPLRVRSSSIGGRLKRDMTAGVFAQGGAFVPTILRLPVIELLRNLEILDKVGMQTMAGLTGNIVIPRQEAAATAYSLAETQAVTASQQVLGQIALSPHRVGVQQVYSRLFLIQSAPDAEEFLRMDMLTVLALLSDSLGLNGQGAANEPLGLMNVPGTAAELFGATPTYAKIVDMETQVRTANVRSANAGPCAYISTPKTRGKLKVTPAALTGSTVVSGTSNALWTGGEEEGEMNGYPAWDTNQIPGDRVLFGAFRQLIRAIWGGLSVIVDPYTKAGQDEYQVTMNSYLDYAVRHPQAFCISSDSGAQ